MWPTLAQAMANASAAQMQHLHNAVYNASKAVDSVVEWEPKLHLSLG